MSFSLRRASSSPRARRPLVAALTVTGQAGNGFATADGLNNGDVVVGEFDTGDFTALKWPAGSATPTDLSQLPTLAKSFFNTQATAVNDSGVIVGDGGVGDGGQDAFIRQNGTTTNLNTLIPAGSGVTLNTAASINDHGVIVGVATTATGGTVGYELTPA